MAIYAEIITDRAVMQDWAPAPAYFEVIEEAADISEVLADLRAVLGQIDEVAAAADAFYPYVLFGVEINDSMDMSDVVQNAGIVGEVIGDGMIIALGDITSGDPYVAWVMNANTDGISKYENFSLNSMAMVSGVPLGADEDGIYELEGDDDIGTPISATVRLGKDDFGESLMKRILKAYLGVSASGRLYLRTITGNGEERTYRTSTNTTLREMKVDLGRGVKSRYWQFEIANVDGADFELETIQFFPVVLSRHF
jgi:hypothetical protein